MNRTKIFKLVLILFRWFAQGERTTATGISIGVQETNLKIVIIENSFLRSMLE